MDPQNRRTRVYIAGPMTNGGGHGFHLMAIRNAILVNSVLLESGYAPLCPQMTVLGELIAPRPYENWLGADLPWVAVADVVLRLDGASKGADREVEFALAHNIPVVYSVLQLLQTVPSYTEIPNEAAATPAS